MTDETNPVIVERVADARSSIEELEYIAGHETTPLVVAQAALRAKAVIEAALEAMPSLVELREALEAVSNHILAEPSIKQIARTALAKVRDVGGGV